MKIHPRHTSDTPHADLIEAVMEAAEALRQHGDSALGSMLEDKMLTAHNARVKMIAERDGLKTALAGARSMLSRYTDAEPPVSVRRDGSMSRAEPMDAIEHACTGLGATRLTKGRLTASSASCTMHTRDGSIFYLQARRVGGEVTDELA